MSRARSSLRALLCAAAALVAAAPLATSPADAEYRVVVHATNPVDSITRADLSAMFLKRTRSWPGGTPVEPVDQAEGSAVHERFCGDVHGRSAASIRTYWARLVFAGRDKPPERKASDGEVVAFVRSHAGAVGYVLGSAPVAGVKVIEVK